MNILKRYLRLENEHEHYQRRLQLLCSITHQKQEELKNCLDHIHRLMASNEGTCEQSITKVNNEGFIQCFYNHGDHLGLIPLEEYSLTNNKDDETIENEFEDDSLLQRLKLIRPGRLKIATKTIDEDNQQYL